MKIKFQISQKYDGDLIYIMLKGEDWEDRTIRMEIGSSLAKKIHKAPNQALIQNNIEIYLYAF